MVGVVLTTSILGMVERPPTYGNTRDVGIVMDGLLLGCYSFCTIVDDSCLFSPAGQLLCMIVSISFLLRNITGASGASKHVFDFIDSKL